MTVKDFRKIVRAASQCKVSLRNSLENVLNTCTFNASRLLSELSHSFKEFAREIVDSQRTITLCNLHVGKK